jgi:hypothetical protein
VERSIDRATWQERGRPTDTHFDDDSLTPDVRYYYQLTAVGAGDVVSEPVSADITLAGVLAAHSDTIVASADDRVSVAIPSATLENGTVCQLANVSAFRAEGRQAVTDAYELTCKNGDGGVIAALTMPLRWQFNLKDQLKGLDKPVAGQMYEDKLQLHDGLYDAKATRLTATFVPTGRVAVFASAPSRFWINFGLIGLGILGLLAVLLFLPFQFNKKQNYQAYLRAKYYNL